MASKQHITELHIKNYRQFRRLHLNFCDPETNEPLEKICFIGPNGTGKTTLLNLLSGACQSDFTQRVNWINTNALVCWQIQVNEKRYFIFKFNRNSGLANTYINLTLPCSIKDSKEWHFLWSDDRPFNVDHPLFRHFEAVGNEFQDLFTREIALQPNGSDLAIHSLADGVQLNSGVPNTNLSNALSLSKELPAFHRSNSGDLRDFWNFLIYQIKKRESDYHGFLTSEAVQTLSVAEARRRFDAEHPEILGELAQQWNLILEQAGLEFDVKNAKIPVQLNENLEAYIRLKNSDNIVDYNLLDG